MALYKGNKLLAASVPGKSAYEHALAGGYTGTEEEFNILLANIDDIEGSIPITSTPGEDVEAWIDPDEDNEEFGYTKSEIDEMFDGLTAEMVGAEPAGTAAGLVANRLPYNTFTLEEGDLSNLEKAWSSATNYTFFQGNSSQNQGIAFFGLKNNSTNNVHCSPVFICRGRKDAPFLLGLRNGETGTWNFYGLNP